MVLSQRGNPEWDELPRTNKGQFGRKKQIEVVLSGKDSLNKNSRQGFNPWKQQKQSFDDFQTYFLPTDDIWSSSGTGDDALPGLSHLQYLAEQRVGVAWKIAKKPAEDAVRNEFTIRDRQNNETMTDELFDFLHDEYVDFYNQLALALYFNRVYGTGFLMTYFTDSDKKNDDFSKPAPKGKRPVSYQAFPPTLMSPINAYQSEWLTSNPQKWDLMGGQYNSTTIHHSRVHVIMTRPSVNRWRGISVFEPIWIPLMSYFQAMVYMLRAFSEMGNVIPAWLIDAEEDQIEIIDLYADLLDEMKMNGKYVGKKGDEFIFQNTHIGDGLQNLMEIWKEDIASGSNMPIPILFGRVANAGLGSGGYLMAERYYWNEVSNIQRSLSDDVIRIIRAAGFKDIDFKKRVDWQLAITKTDQQRLMDEGMELQNEILKEDLIQRRLQTGMMMDQFKQMKENPENFQVSGNNMLGYEPQQKEQGQQKQERDFIIEKILEERSKMNEYMWGARKVA